MRLVYSLLLYLLAPLVVGRLAWRGIAQRAYWQRWPERFGFIPHAQGPAPLWVHAVSVGEVTAAVPLVQLLRKRHPQVPIVVTTVTPTGSQRVLEAFGASVQHVYSPYDLPDAVARFLGRIRPRAVLIMETELWPNLFHACGTRNIPLVIANARLGTRSFAGYRRVRRLIAGTLKNVTVVAAQSRADAERFLALGAPSARVQVTGSIKFDLRLPASLREQAAVLRRTCGVNRPVWIVASTHEGEEEQVLQAFAQVRLSLPACLLVLVPRHPERFGRVAALCRRNGYRVVLRSSGARCPGDADVFLGDSMGELMLFYAASDVAFVGGSLVPTGGHNMLEPAALGVPVIFGPHTFNFEEIARLLITEGAAWQVHDVAELAGVAASLLRDANLRHAAGERARQVVERNRGALERLMEMVEPLISAEAPAPSVPPAIDDAGERGMP